MRALPLRKRRQRGIIMLLFTLMAIFVIFPAVGLAIDAGIMFAIKAKLQTATDGAALAAARSLSRGIDLPSQQGAAVETAERFFEANVHDNWLGLKNPQIDVDFPAAPPKTTIVRVDSSVDAPAYFMRILGWDMITVRAAGAANRRDVNIVLVLDRSASLGPDCPALRGAANTFVDSFVDGRDNLGLVTFGTTYRNDFDLATDFKSRAGGQDMVTLVNNITCVGGTNAGVAYWTAYQRLLNLNEPGALNVILFFTDGLPTAVHLPAIQMKTSGTTYCSSTAPKDGVMTVGGTTPWGIHLANEPNPPGSVINPDYSQPAPNTTNCWFRGGSFPAYRYSQVSTDVIGLAPSAGAQDVSGISLYGWKNIATGSGRVSLSGTNIINAATNVLDNAAQQVRTQSVANGLEVVTYCVGLGSVDDDLLNRVANTPDSGIYNSGQPVGLYIYASNAAQLQQAFATLASDILRLSM